MKNSFLKILTAIMFLQSHIVLAQTSNTVVVSGQQIRTNISGAETCVKSTTVVVDESGGFDQAYENCLARNKQRGIANDFIGQAQNDTQQVNSGTVGAAPVNNCAADDDACLQQYYKSVETYNRKVSAGNQANAAQNAAAAAVTEEQKKIAELNDKTASGSMNETGEKSGDGETLYKVAGVALAGFATYKFIEASSYAGPCFSTGISCQVMGAALVAGAAFMILNGKANDQADELCKAKTEACEAGNQMSSTQKVCAPCVPAGNGNIGGGGGSGGGIGGFVSPINPELPPPTDPRCATANPPSDCVHSSPGGGGTIGKLPTQCAGKTGAAAASCMAGLPGAYKQNGNGSVTVKGLKGDKTYTAADFADKKSMMALGLTAEQADKLMNDMYGPNSALAKAGLELAKGEKNSLNFSTPPATASLGTSGLSDSKKFGEKLGDVADRRPSSEGLSRDFNGDLIGAAGDDIFSMMKRRYNLKTQQDSFITP